MSHFSTPINRTKPTTLLWQKRPEVYLSAWKGRGSHPTRLKLRYPEDTPLPVKDLLNLLPTAAWTRATIKEGSQGPLVCDFAFWRVVEARHGLPGPDLWLVIRRTLDHPAVVKFYFSQAPCTTPLTELSGLRWPLETRFEEGQGQVAFDHYETRAWLGWQQPLLLLALAHFFLVPLTLLSALFAPLAFLGGFWVALIGVALWGLGMGVHESIIPAAVAQMVPVQRRASAYGLFTAGYGVFWFLGSAALGILYGVSLPALIAFSLVTELAAIPLFLVVRRQFRPGTTDVSPR